MLFGIFDLVWFFIEVSVKVLYSFFKFIYDTYKENKRNKRNKNKKIESL